MPDLALSLAARPDARAAFLAETPAAGWRREPLAGDASGRAYERLRGPGGETLVLMDAGAERATVAPFLAVGRHLSGLGLAAPAVIAADEGRGLLLLEDLGPRTLAAHLADRPGDAAEAYAAAVDVLARIQAAPPPAGPGLALVALTPARAAAMLAPLWEHHAPGAGPRAAAVEARLADALDRHAGAPDVLSLRDYHAENLIWRPDREGTGRVGLLDFQDAVLAPPEYDLASLGRDARRDVDDASRALLRRRFAAATGRDEARVAAAAAVLGVARNLRILGIFARLARGGRTSYLRLGPRVWAHVKGDLAHPALARLAEAVRAAVPPPAGAA
jgi:aminoglycoside/choline kinase family phosphotransferase